VPLPSLYSRLKVRPVALIFATFRVRCLFRTQRWQAGR